MYTHSHTHAYRRTPTDTCCRSYSSSGGVSITESEINIKKKIKKTISHRRRSTFANAIHNDYYKINRNDKDTTFLISRRDTVLLQLQVS